MRPLLESPVELAGLPPRSCIAKGFAGGTTLCGDDTDTDEVEDDVLNGTRWRCGIRCACGWACCDDEPDVDADMDIVEGGMRLLALLLAVLSVSAAMRGAGVMSILGSIVEERVRPARPAEDGCELLLFGSVGVAAGVARRPPPVKPADGGMPLYGMSVEDRCRPPMPGRLVGDAGVCGDEVGDDALGVDVAKGGERIVVGESEKTVVSCFAEFGELLVGAGDVTGLMEDVLPELTILIVA